eukprot:TRINITY_DN102910_c0_g1_i1.p1 TRINITY_DN102910_c0_g1~~TRINITY_DN102910_c0_g1_i1.p1  ORF type:complete len:1547 (-),score=253.21 TRINITY_DN102910_c0_g1_i1:218-4858(-)
MAEESKIDFQSLSSKNPTGKQTLIEARLFGEGLPGGGEDAVGLVIDGLRRRLGQHNLAASVEAFRDSTCDLVTSLKAASLKRLLLEELQSVVAALILRDSKETQSQKHGEPKQLWERVVAVYKNRQHVGSLRSEAHNTLLSHRLLLSKVAPLKRDESWGERYGRLETFFADLKENPCKVNAKRKTPVVMDPYLRSLPKQAAGHSSPQSSTASPWPQKERSKQDRSLGDLSSRDSLPSTMLSTLSWKDRSGKSRCKAAQNIWEWSQHVPPTPQVVSTPSSSSSRRDQVTKPSEDTLLPPIFSATSAQGAGMEEEAGSWVTDLDASPMARSMMTEEGNAKMDLLSIFPGLAKRKPQPTRRLVFDDRPGTGKKSKARGVREIKVYAGGRTRPSSGTSSPRTSDFDEAARLLKQGSETSQSSSRPSLRKGTLRTSASDSKLQVASLSRMHRSRSAFSTQEISAHNSMMEHLMSLAEDEFEDVLFEERTPDAMDPQPDRVFDRSFRRDFSVPVRPPVNQNSLRGSEKGLPPINQKGSFWDPQRESEGGYAPHITRYLETCADGNMIPELLPFVTGHSPKLEANGRQLSDHDLLAINAVLNQISGVSAVNLGNNGLLTDRSVVPFLSKMREQPLPAALVSMNFESCRMLGQPSMMMLAGLLEAQMASRLKILNINGIRLHTSVQLPLCQAIKEHAGLREVHMADTKISGAECMEALFGNVTLESYDLAWNCFDEACFSTIGELAAQNPTLAYLNLSNCAATTAGGEASPITHFLEWLSGNRGLTHLDVCSNQIDFRGALVLEDALNQHAKLSRLTISNNPLGVLGMRSMLRLLTSGESGFVYFDCEGCSCDLEAQMANLDQIFRAIDPGGSYLLNLSKPYHRALLRMLCRAAERFKIPLADAFVLIAVEPEFKLPEKKEGSWVVPTSGELSMSFSMEKGMGSGTSDKWDFGSVMDLHLSTMRVKPSPEKVCHLMALWGLLKYALERQVFLNALSKDFALQPAHIEQLCRHREMGSEVVWRLLSCVEGGQHGRFMVLVAQPTIGAYLQSVKRAASLLNFNTDNPTGHYKFDLGDPMDFFVAQRLVVLDRWEALLRRELRWVDTSQRGNNSCFFNERYQDLPIISSSLANWRMPENGILELDYVSGKRLDCKTKALDEATFVKILVALTSCESDPLDQVKASLRPVSHQISLECRQLRSLVRLFDISAVRAELFVTFIFRVVDVQHEKMVRVGFEKEELALLQKRLGHCAMFPFLQPEDLCFDYNLEFVDQRCACLILFKICEAENVNNIKDAVFTSKIGEGFEEDEALLWRNSRDGSMDKMPTQGTFQGTYVCAPEERDFKNRKNVLQTYGFWQCSVAEEKVSWWSALETIPEDILKFLEWILPRYSDLASAFKAIDESVPSEERASQKSMTAKEFEDAITALGLGSLTATEIQSVFKYLDPLGDGVLAKEQQPYKRLQPPWNEMMLSIEEFVKLMQRRCGNAVQAWWEALGLNEVKYDEWGATARKLGFVGSARQVFKFLDKNGKGIVSFEEFKLLGSVRVNSEAEVPARVN